MNKDLTSDIKEIEHTATTMLQMNTKVDKFIVSPGDQQDVEQLCLIRTFHDDMFYLSSYITSLNMTLTLKK